MSTAVTVPEDLATKQPKTIHSLLKSEQFKDAVAAALPKHLSKDRFIRVALNAVMRKPELLSCTQESFFLCLLDLSMYGLEPDGRRAHLIPFKRKIKEAGKADRWVTDCQLIIDYKGIAECVRRSGDVSYIHADVVYEGDEFRFRYGSGAFLEHTPAENRGAGKKWAYSFVKLRDGAEDFIVISMADVNKIRARSKSSDSGPWVTDYDEMAKKTVFRRHSKWLPLSAEIRDVIERDDEITGSADPDKLLDMAGSIENARDRTVVMPQRITQEDIDKALAEKAAADKALTEKAVAEKIPEYPDFAGAPDPMELEPGAKIKVGGKTFMANEDRTAFTELK